MGTPGIYYDPGDFRWVLPSRWEELFAVCQRHFPKITSDTDNFDPQGRNRHQFNVGYLVGITDNSVRDACRQTMSQRAGGIFFDEKNSPTKILRGMAKAIEKRDSKAYNALEQLNTSYINELINEAESNLYGEYHSHSLDDILTLVTAIAAMSVKSAMPKEYEDALAEHGRVLAAAAGIASKRRRPSSEWSDDAIADLVQLWSWISGKPPRQPSHATGSSNRAGSMVAFVAEAAAIYRDFGLTGGLPANSGSAWSRILKRFR